VGAAAIWWRNLSRPDGSDPHRRSPAPVSGNGWGEPHSLGHYVDLSSTVLGVTLLTVAVVLRVIRARPSLL
jgi:hypothetical protein